MKTTKNKTRKTSLTSTTRRPGTKLAPGAVTTIVRDLLIPIYIFGEHPAADQFITRLDLALEKVQTGENFYIRTDDRVYYSNLQMYRASGINIEDVIERLRGVLDSGEEKIENAPEVPASIESERQTINRQKGIRHLRGKIKFAEIAE